MKEELTMKVAELNRELKGNVISTGDNEKYSIKRLPSGIFPLDEKLNGGFPSGRIVVVWGKFGSGKTTLCLNTVTEAQKAGLQCAWINTEKVFDQERAVFHGVNVEDLIVIDSESQEVIIKATVPLIQEKLVDVIVVDSISPIRFTAYYDDDKNTIGNHSRAIGEMLEKFNHVNDNTLIMLISQIRAKSKGQHFVMGHQGGNALDHYSSLDVRLDDPSDGKVGAVKNDEIYEYSRIHFKITKAKTSRPYESGSFVINADGSINFMEQVIAMGVRDKVIRKSGNWFIVQDSTGQDIKLNGREAFEDYLADNAGLYKELKDEISRRIFG